MYNLYKKIKELIETIKFKLRVNKLKSLDKRFSKYDHKCTHLNCMYGMKCTFTAKDFNDYLDGRRPICLGGIDVALKELKAVKHNKNRK